MSSTVVIVSLQAFFSRYEGGSGIYIGSGPNEKSSSGSRAFGILWEVVQWSTYVSISVYRCLESGVGSPSHRPIVVTRHGVKCGRSGSQSVVGSPAHSQMWVLSLTVTYGLYGT